jgi:NADPH:quinone reductase-like Zn-dependent oxidoreductase
VVAIAGTDEKLALAAELGADLLLRNDDKIVSAVRTFTDGRGADAALDHVGAATWQTSVDCLRVGGRLVMFGNVGGDRISVSLAAIYHRGLRLLGAGGYHGADFAAALAAFAAGGLRAVRAAEFELAELDAAFDVLEARDTIGKVLVRP